MKDIFVRLAAAVLVGGFISVITVKEVWVYLFLFCMLLFLGIVFVWKPRDFVGRMVKPEVILVAFSLLVGFICGIPAEKKVAPPLIIDNVAIQGRLMNWSMDGTAGRGMLLVEDGEQRVSSRMGCTYNLRVYPDDHGNYLAGWDGVRAGDHVTFTCRLEQPKTPGTDGEFNLPLYNAVRGISGTLTAKGDVAIVEAGVPGFT
ncbi:DUF4131 domain-containing protein [Dehalobacter sp. DCM]|uniref:DUF4131 domain-containing protein n=1 Tax=Dehalobacter sp. DCM TaxID=2907827 RepID=UPI0030813EBA|nr:DUF4131 domain-containing protein [Dehalobacter sp. DCM]